MAGCAVLTKSVLGFFPIVIGVVFMFWHGSFKKIFDPGFMTGVVLALLVGCSWYLINWSMFGDAFIYGHFKTHHMKLLPQDFLSNNPLYIFGYLKDMMRNYWPWFPVTVVGVFLFAKSSFREKDCRSIFLFLWVFIPFVIMSTSRNQTLRYLFMIFPAFGIITAHTLAGWLKDSQKEKALPWMIGAVMTIVLVINATPIQVKVSLNQNNHEVRDLAPFVHINTRPGEKIFNYGFTPWNPTQVLAFYSGRFLEYPVKDAETLIQKLDKNPKGTWLSPVSTFKELKNKFPGKLYLIYGNQKFAYFTSIRNRENITYNFFDTKVPIVR